MSLTGLMLLRGMHHARCPCCVVTVLYGAADVATLPLQLGHYGGMADEIDALKRDKNVLMLELVRLRQQQQVRHCMGSTLECTQCGTAVWSAQRRIVMC